MIILRDDEAAPGSDASAVAIGVFDGLHLGHQRVIAQVRSLASAHGARATIVTFDPHPALVLAPESAPLQLGTIEQRLEGFEALGVDQVRILHFTPDMAEESAQHFVERVLVGELRACCVVVGEDFQFGHDRGGDVAMLSREGEKNNFEVHAAPIYGGNQRWSSTAVRNALGGGDLFSANALLGRPFTLRGVVEHGDARGAQLGFKTANLALDARQQLPELGIYAGAARTAARTWWPASISVGTRPQFYDDGQVLVEVHLSGYDGDLYGHDMDVAFMSRLRDEMTFATSEELVAQIDHDVVETLDIYKRFIPASSPLLG
ncbi:MAG: bifunctional riboflavin kinase/FAD synthetase [Acidimicrobiales bacterium]